MAMYTKIPRMILGISRAVKQTSNYTRWQKHRVKGSMLIGGFFGSPKTTQNKQEELPKLEEPDASKLSREYLIKLASIKTAEEIGTLVLQTALALIQAEKEYTEAMFALVILMEYKLKVLDNKREEERIWDLILQGRDLVNKTKTKKRTLEMIFVNSKNMLSTAAEVAYMTGAEFAGSLAGDRLYKVEQHLKVTQRESEDAEIKLRNVEAKTIEVEAEHANKTSEDSNEASQNENENNKTQTNQQSESSDDHSNGNQDKSNDPNSVQVPNELFPDNGVKDFNEIKDLKVFRGKFIEKKNKDISDQTGKVLEQDEANDKVDGNIVDKSIPSSREHEDLKF